MANFGPEARADGEAVWLAGTLETETPQPGTGRARRTRHAEQNGGAPDDQGTAFCSGRPECLLQATLTMESSRQKKRIKQTGLSTLQESRGEIGFPPHFDYGTGSVVRAVRITAAVD
jgi:hypothetical protein